MSITYTDGRSTHEGTVLALTEVTINDQAPQRVAAVVDAQQVRTVVYDDTRYTSTTTGAVATVDADSVALAEARAYLMPKLVARMVALHLASQQVMRYADRVVVRYGRHAGREGVVRWINTDRISKADHGPRTYVELGVLFDGHTDWFMGPEAQFERAEMIPPHMQSITAAAEAKLSTLEGIANAYRTLS